MEFTITGNASSWFVKKSKVLAGVNPASFLSFELLFFLSSFPRNGPAISAICIYDLSSVNRILNESYFKTFTCEAKGWTKKRNKMGEYFPGVSTGPRYSRQG